MANGPQRTRAPLLANGGPDVAAARFSAHLTHSRCQQVTYSKSPLSTGKVQHDNWARFFSSGACVLGSLHQHGPPTTGLSPSPRPPRSWRAVRGIAHLMQPLLVILHACLHQQARDTVLPLHHLPHQQMPVPQGAPSIPYRCSIMWHSERKSHRKQSAILLASIWSFFFLAAAMARSING